MILFNKKEEKLVDVSKLKKRKIGRGFKVIGDYCLMINSFDDAILNFNKSLEILKKNEDWLWSAGCVEGICAAFFIKFCKNE